MNTTPQISALCRALCVALCIASTVVTSMSLSSSAWSAATPDDNSSLRNTHIGLVVPLDVAVVAGLVPFAPVSRPAEIVEYALNLGLKGVPPALYMPSDKTFSPNSSDTCTREFSIPDIASDPGAYAYTDWFGFWTIHNIADGVNDWGDLTDLDSRGRIAAPRIKHANSSVNLSVNFSADRDSSGGGVALPEGVHTVTWQADTMISPFWDVQLPLYLMAFDAAAEARYGSAAAKKVAKASAKSAERLKRKLAREAAKNVAKVASIRTAEYFLGSFTDSNVSASNRGVQTVTVWDIHTPYINASQTTFELEAMTFGGTSFARVQEEVMASLNYGDDCGRAVTLTSDVPSFLPIGSTDVTWTVSDAGPYRSDIEPTASITQTFVVADTQPPILRAPVGFAEYAFADRSIDDEDFSLGIAQVIDLADPAPTVSHDAPDILERDTRYLITWNATDASGNTTEPEDDDAANYQQIVTIKSPGTNTAPEAHATSADAITGERQTITLTGEDFDPLDLFMGEGIDPIAGVTDPLDFLISEHPDNGQFIAPLRPFFIEDYRVTPVGETERQQDNVIIRTSPLRVMVEDRELDLATPFQQALAIERGTYLNGAICNAEPGSDSQLAFNNVIPVNFVYEPSYVHIDDEGFSYIRDHFFKCGEDLVSGLSQGGELDPIPRISKWTEDGTLVAMHELYPLQGETYPDNTLNTTNAWPVSTFSFDATGRIWTFTYPIITTFTQSLKTLSIDSDLTTLSYHGGAGYSETEVINGNAFIGVAADPVREILYELHSSGIRAFPLGEDYSVQQAPAHGPDKINRDCEHFTCVDGSDIEVDSDGNLYVLDGAANRVHKFGPPILNSDGSWEVGEYVGWMGSCETELTNDDGVPYLACDDNEGVSYGYLCSDEKCTRPTDTNGDAPGQFDSPQSIEVGPDDMLYVADTENSRVQRFGQDGTFAGQARSTGTGINQGDQPGFILGNMGKPKYLAVNSNAFYVMEPAAEFGDHFVHVYKTLPFYDLTENSAKVDYVSDVNFQGEDSFIFRVDDGIDVSEPAEVSITVNRAFRAPYDLRAECYSNALYDTVVACEVNEDEDLYLRLRATEPDGFIGNGGLDVHSISLLSDVANGSLTLIDTQVSHLDYRYRPTQDYYGSDGFSFMVNDGVDDAETPGEVSITVIPQRDPTDIDMPENIQVARGFSKGLAFSFSDVDADSFAQPQATHISWGDGTLSALDSDWINIGIEDANGDPVDPQINTTAGNGLFVAAHTYDSAFDGVRLCYISDGDSEPSCEASSAVEVIEATQVAASLWSESIVEPESNVEFDIFVLNQKPEFWDGLTAGNVELQVRFPDGISVVSADSRCSLGTEGYDCALGDMLVYDENETAGNDNAETLNFVITIDATTATEDPTFIVDVEISDDGPRLEESTVLPFSLIIADDDGDDVINYNDAFPNDARYSLDEDGDAMADSWELAYGLDPTDAADAALDSDGDGATNAQEFSNDTSPFLAEPFRATQIIALEGDDDNQLGYKLAAGDYNGDGFQDVVATAPAYGERGGFMLAFGSADGLVPREFTEPLPVISNMGKSVAMGDLNNDGFDDIVVGADGVVQINWGTAGGQSGGTLTFASLDDTHNRFGDAVAVADMDGDGLKDLIVSSPLDDVITTDNGVVYIYRASDEYWMQSGTRNPFMVTTPVGDHRIGDSLQVADIDGDGLNDLLIGAAFDGRGAVDGHLGSAFDWDLGEKTLPDFIIDGASSSSRFGFSMAAGEDMDGDDVADLIAGAYREDGTGAAFTFTSQNEYWLATVPTAGTTINGQANGDQFAVSLDQIPPTVFRDQVSAFVIGANRNGEEDEGQVALYFADELATAAFTDTGDAHDMLGYSVIYAGDVNGDGYGDWVAGAPDISTGDHTGEGGYIKLYLGTGIAEQSDTDGDSVADSFDNCVSTANTDQADADSDGEGDVCDSTPGITPTPTATPTSTPTPTSQPDGDTGSGGGGSVSWFMLLMLVLCSSGYRSYKRC